MFFSVDHWMIVKDSEAVVKVEMAMLLVSAVVTDV
jgi:hypothetical protein